MITHTFRFMMTAIAVLMATFTFAQESESALSVQVSNDSVYMGNSFEIRFTAENIAGRFQLPSKWKGFVVLGGPNHSSSMQIVNGVSSQHASISYFLKPFEPGTYTIPPVSYQGKDSAWETPAIELVCLPNLEGVMNHTQITDDGSSMKLPMRTTRFKKKTLKETKI